MANSWLTKQVVKTDDREVAASTISRTYEPTSIEIKPKHDFEFALDAAALGQVTAGRLRVRRASRVFGSGQSGSYHICVPLTGRVICRGASDEPTMVVPGQASLWSPGQVPDTVWAAGTTQMCFMIPPELVAAELEAFLGEPPARSFSFEPIMDLTSDAGQSWGRLVNLLAGEFLTDSGLIQEPVSRGHIERLLVDGLLLGHRHAYSDVIHQRSSKASNSVIAKAVALIDEDPAAPWSVLTLARQVHVSVRSLQEGFRREYGTTPMRHLRDIRLRRVHDDLLAGKADSLTVQQIATRWGLNHMGRFAAQYRSKFGELPSETQRRAQA